MPGQNNGLRRGEHIAPLKGAKNRPHLWFGEIPAEFSTLSEAKRVADRVGGAAYKSPRSAHFLIKFDR